MKIAIDARQYTTSTGRYAYRLIQYLEQLDQTHDYYILLKPEDMEIYPFTNKRFHKVSCPHKEFTFAEQIGLKKQLDAIKPDLVHFAITQQPVLYRGKVITTMHDLTTLRFRNPAKNPLVFWVKLQVYKWVNKRVARKSSRVLTPTKFVKNDVVTYTHISPAKVTVTYEAADHIADSPTSLLDLQNKEFIMYLGRPTPHKNLERLVAAFAELQKTRPSLHLVLAGKQDANYDRHAAQVATEHIPNVIFTGYITDGQLRWLYEHCAAYVFPSLSEGFGLPALEAMIHSAPVVSSNATCLPEVYGDAAHYFDPLNIQDMATKINEVLIDPKLRKTLIAKGKLQAAKYSWQRMAEQTLAIYNQVLHDR